MTSHWRAAWFAFSDPRSRATNFADLRLLRQYGVWLGAGWATANGACAREPHRPPRWAWWCFGCSCRAKPLLGWWFGCPGAGPIRARHRMCSPTKVLTKEYRFANSLGRERGPENGYPDRRPLQGLNEPCRNYPRQQTKKTRIRKRLNPCTFPPSPPAPPA
jgi:hypothetical protein